MIQTAAPSSLLSSVTCHHRLLMMRLSNNKTSKNNIIPAMARVRQSVSSKMSTLISFAAGNSTGCSGAHHQPLAVSTFHHHHHWFQSLRRSFSLTTMLKIRFLLAVSFPSTSLLSALYVTSAVQESVRDTTTCGVTSTETTTPTASSN